MNCVFKSRFRPQFKRAVFQPQLNLQGYIFALEHALLGKLTSRKFTFRSRNGLNLCTTSEGEFHRNSQHIGNSGESAHGSK